MENILNPLHIEGNLTLLDYYAAHVLPAMVAYYGQTDVAAEAAFDVASQMIRKRSSYFTLENFGQSEVSPVPDAI